MDLVGRRRRQQQLEALPVGRIRALICSTLMRVSPVIRKAAQLGLVVLMLLAGMMMWLGSPLIWLWIGAQLTDSQQPQFGPYMVVALGILATTVVLVFALSRLNRIYEQLVGERQTVRVRLPWMRNFSDPGNRQSAGLTVFDAVLVFTALTALLALVGWFFLFAGSPLPDS